MQRRLFKSIKRLPWLCPKHENWCRKRSKKGKILREEDVENFWKNGIINKYSNYVIGRRNIRNNDLFKFIKNNTNFKLMNETFFNILNLPYLYYRNHTTGEIISRINDIDVVKDVVEVVTLLFTDIIFTIIIYIICKSKFFTLVKLFCVIFLH